MRLVDDEEDRSTAHVRCDRVKNNCHGHDEAPTDKGQSTLWGLLKASFNADEDGLAGIQQLAHDANLLFYMSEEAAEGRQAFLEKRKPDFTQFPYRA